ncbi:MAG: PIN domain nuclease [Streptosporangiaceae bacterium]
MAVARYLPDTSAWARIRHPVVHAAVAPLADRGLLGTCSIIDLEILYSARTGTEHEYFGEQRTAFDYFPMTDEIARRAIEVQGVLAQKSQHRSVSIPDLMIAATAERYALTVLHYDGDYERIAEVTGQATQWIVPRGTADLRQAGG